VRGGIRPPHAEGNIAGVTMDSNQIIWELNSVAGNDARFIRASIRRMISLVSADIFGKKILSASLPGKLVPKNCSTSELNDLESSNSIELLLVSNRRTMFILIRISRGMSVFGQHNLPLISDLNQAFSSRLAFY